MIADRRRRLDACAAALALVVTLIGLVWNTRVAAGSDAYGYVSQVDLWLRGDLHIDQSFAAGVPWPGARLTFLPLGYRAADGSRIVPQYPPGLPLMMAAAKLLGGQCAMFWVVPLCGGALVLATYAIGVRIDRPAIGLASAWIVATSPAMLFMLMAPMSDVPAAAAWAVAIAGALGDTAAAATIGGAAAALAILIRPNLAPLAAVIALWLAVASLTRVRALAFGLAASIGALAVALVNARLYGSPLQSGYDLTDGFALAYAWPNMQRYVGWLISAETPVALAGLVALAVPSVALWRTDAARRAHSLFASFAAVVWMTYLLYVPWDAWWYLRFLLPSWPMMAIGTAAVLGRMGQMGRMGRMGRAGRAGRAGGAEGVEGAGGAGRAGTAGTGTDARVTGRSRGTTAIGRIEWRRALVAVVLLALGVHGVVEAARRETFNVARGEAKYVEVAGVVESITDPDAVIISMQHSGSLRYYAGRLTLRWDIGEPAWLDRTIDWLAAHGHHPYFVLEPQEIDALRARSAARSASARLDWTPMVVFENGGVRMFDALRREQGAAPVVRRPRGAIRECLIQKQAPGLRADPR
ncbi:MAG TPA: hypothetical protein VKE51_01765 [Vicinamibacterales bacterium]|nr:hypothetical protein [Vicinamibacterales bacterium]